MRMPRGLSCLVNLLSLQFPQGLLGHQPPLHWMIRCLHLLCHPSRPPFASSSLDSYSCSACHLAVKEICLSIIRKGFPHALTTLADPAFPLPFVLGPCTTGAGVPLACALRCVRFYTWQPCIHLTILTLAGMISETTSGRLPSLLLFSELAASGRSTSGSNAVSDASLSSSVPSEG